MFSLIKTLAGGALRRLRKCISVLIVCSLALGSASSCARSGAVAPVAQVSEGPPALGVLREHPRVSWADAGTRARLGFSTREKKLWVLWVDPGGAATQQDVALEYYPTAATLISPGKVAVAGKADLGATVIQVLDFVPPTGIAYDATGKPILFGMSVSAVQLAYREATLGRDVVLRMLKDPLDSQVIYLQFWDSRDVYSLNIRDRTLNLIASPDALTSGLYVASLGSDWRGWWTKVHAVQGTMIVLKGRGPAADTLVLFDDLSDGTFESAEVLTPQEWYADGYNDPGSYSL